MAVLTIEQKVEFMQAMAADSPPPIDWDKPTIYAAVQAIEDWFESERATVSTLIDTATSPFVFTNPQKKKLARWFLKQKSLREA